MKKPFVLFFIASCICSGASARSPLCGDFIRSVPVQWNRVLINDSSPQNEKESSQRCGVDTDKETVTVEQLKCMVKADEDHNPLAFLLWGVNDIIDQVRDSGVNEFAGIDLSELRGKTAELKFREFSEGLLLGSGGSRHTAINLSSEKLIVLNGAHTLFRHFLKDTKAFAAVVLLHEGLGALGYEDENYERSLGLWRASQLGSEAREFSAAFEKTFGNTKKQTCEAAYKSFKVAGGASVVGGGGELPEVIFKVKLLEAVDARFGKDSSFQNDLKILGLRVRSSQIESSGYDRNGNTYTLPSAWKRTNLNGKEYIWAEEFDIEPWVNRALDELF